MRVFFQLVEHRGLFTSDIWPSLLSFLSFCGPSGLAVLHFRSVWSTPSTSWTPKRSFQGRSILLNSVLARQFGTGLKFAGVQTKGNVDLIFSYTEPRRSRCMPSPCSSVQTLNVEVHENITCGSWCFKFGRTIVAFRARTLSLSSFGLPCERQIHSTSCLDPLDRNEEQQAVPHTSESRHRVCDTRPLPLLAAGLCRSRP